MDKALIIGSSSATLLKSRDNGLNHITKCNEIADGKAESSHDCAGVKDSRIV